MGVSFQLHDLTAFLQGMLLVYLLSRRLSECQGGYGCCVVEGNFLFLSGIKPQFLDIQPVTWSLYCLYCPSCLSVTRLHFRRE